MNRYALEISYEGGAFGGWQSQSDGRGVQDALERALLELGERTRADSAGRTDAGVHARAQVASLSLSQEWEPRRLVLALNAKLPPSVSVMRAARTDDSFHSRRSAVSREYRYFIWNGSACYPHIKPFVCWLPGKYDWARAAAAAKRLEGSHDFRAFCRKADCPESAIRNVLRARLIRRGNLVIFQIEANAFLTNMIRIAAGNLLEIAKGRQDADWLSGLLSGLPDRSASAKTLNPSGLFFWRARYPFPIEWHPTIHRAHRL